MKNIGKSFLNVLQILLKTVLVVVLFCGCFTYLNKVFYNRDVDRGTSFHSLPENSMDVLVIGSSHAQYSFQPGFFYEDTGLYSYVLGSACQPLEVSVQMLKEALKTQSPKLVFLEGYTALPQHIDMCLADSCYVTAEYQMRGEEKYKTISYLPEEKAETYYNDYMAYHNDWKTLEDWDIFSPKKALAEENGVSSDLGYVYSEPVYPISNFWGPRIWDTEAGQLAPLDEQSLNEIYEICQQNGIQLYLSKTPIDGISEEDYASLLALWQWAEDHNVPYYDFLSHAEELGYYMQVHSDGFHTYVNGAAFATDTLALKLQEMNLAFTHTSYKELDDLYRTSAQPYTGYDVNFEDDPLKVLLRLRHSSAYVLLRYLPSAGDPSEELLSSLRLAGFTDFNKDEPYFAILHNGEIVVSGQEEVSTEAAGLSVSCGPEWIRLGDTEHYGNGLMSVGYLSENGIYRSFLDIEYRGSTWKYGGYNYETLFSR